MSHRVEQNRQRFAEPVSERYRVRDVLSVSRVREEMSAGRETPSPEAKTVNDRQEVISSV